MSAQAHAELNGRVFVVVDDDTNVAAVGHHDVHQEPWGSREVFLGQFLDVLFADHRCAVGESVLKKPNFAGQKRGLVAPVRVFIMSFRGKSTQFGPSVLPSLHVVRLAHD